MKTRIMIGITGEETMRKLQKIALDDKRSYRATLEILIDREYERRHPAGKDQKKECGEVK